MPPDQQRDRGDGGQQRRHHLAGALLRLGDLAEIADAEVVELTGLDVVAARERAGHLRDRGRHQVGAAGLDVDAVDVAGHAPG